jgi:putative acetyltransferase
LNLTIRLAIAAEYPALARLFYLSVRNGAGSYSDVQREAWAPAVPALEPWADRLARQTVIVAERDDGIAGFMTMDVHGYIDLAFVRPECIGCGVGSALYGEIERIAVNAGHTAMTVQASDMARYLFERRGWTLIESTCVERQGIALPTHQMRKELVTTE